MRSEPVLLLGMSDVNVDAQLKGNTLRVYVYVPVVLWFTGFLALAAIIFWYEAQRAWRSAPSP